MSIAESIPGHVQDRSVAGVGVYRVSTGELFGPGNLEQQFLCNCRRLWDDPVKLRIGPRRPVDSYLWETSVAKWQRQTRKDTVVVPL